MRRIIRINPLLESREPSNFLTLLDSDIGVHCYKLVDYFFCKPIIYPLMLTQMATCCLPALSTYIVNDLTNNSIHPIANQAMRFATLGYYEIENEPILRNQQLSGADVEIGFVQNNNFLRDIDTFLSNPSSYIDDSATQCFLYDERIINPTSSDLIGAPNHNNLKLLSFVKNYFEFNKNSNLENTQNHENDLKENEKTIRREINNAIKNNRNKEKNKKILENLESFIQATKEYGKISNDNQVTNEVNYKTFEILFKEKKQELNKPGKSPRDTSIPPSIPPQIKMTP